MKAALNIADIDPGTMIPDRRPVSQPVRKILLLDGYSTRTLACVRSWGRKHIDFVVGGESRWDMSLLSRYASETCVYTSPRHDISKFITDVNRHCVHFGADHIFPTAESAIMACSEHEGEFVSAPIIPRRHELKTAFNKRNTLRIGELVGIPAPKTIFLTVHDSAVPNGTQLRFPVVVKSESSETLSAGRSVSSGKTFYASNQAELERECALRLSKGESILLQEFIDGYGIGVSGLFSAGRPVALIGHRRLRESNPMGGPSALAETIEIDPWLLKVTAALVSEIGFTGPAMVEYKVDRRDGRPYLMEINGRFWGSVLVALAAGLDLPYLFWKMLTGLEIRDEEKRYRVGVRGRSIVGDTRCLVECLKGRPKFWPGQMPGRSAAIKAYCASFFDPETTEMICTSDDPMPFLGRLLQPNS
jgi:predicted ATP-grasp superfamily ATP-dependent carboligase